MWLLKRYILPQLYWHGMLKGLAYNTDAASQREAARAFFRPLVHPVVHQFAKFHHEGIADRINGARAALLAPQKTRVAEHCELLRHICLGQPDSLHKLADSHLAGFQLLHNRQAGRLRKRAESSCNLLQRLARLFLCHAQISLHTDKKEIEKPGAPSLWGLP